jgi:hypothetical protein
MFDAITPPEEVEAVFNKLTAIALVVERRNPSQAGLRECLRMLSEQHEALYRAIDINEMLTKQIQALLPDDKTPGVPV